MQRSNKLLFCFVKYSNSTGGEAASVAIVNVLTFTQHGRLDLELWVSNIAHFPKHTSPRWSIAFSPESAYQRDEDTSL